MQIAKYLHSCLLFEDEGHRLLFDPGTISFAEGRVSPEMFGDIDTVVITHSHPDHLDINALKQIAARGNPTVIANDEVAAILAQEGMAVTVLNEGELSAGPFRLRAIPTPHEAILADRLPQHTAYVINERVLNAVDSFGGPLLAYAGIDTLIMPVMAPFLTEVGAFAFAKAMRPRQVIPIHDGYSKEFFLRLRHANYAQQFERIGVTFHPLREPGESVTV